MDPTWEFQAPQFVDFNNMGAADNSNADEFFNVDMENGQVWVAAEAPCQEEVKRNGEQDLKKGNIAVAASSARTPSHVSKTLGSSVNPAQKSSLKRKFLGNCGGTRSSPFSKMPRRMKAVSKMYVRDSTKVPTNVNSPKEVSLVGIVGRPQTQVERYLYTPTAARVKGKSQSPPFSPLLLTHARRFKLKSDLQKNFSKMCHEKFQSKNEDNLNHISTTKFKSRAHKARIVNDQSRPISAVPVPKQCTRSGTTGFRKPSYFVESGGTQSSIRTKSINQRKPMLTVPNPFIFQTEIRAAERKKNEMRKQKEAGTTEETNQDKRLNNNNLDKMRKGQVYKAQPVPSYKSIEIKKIDKKMTIPASPRLGRHKG